MNAPILIIAGDTQTRSHLNLLLMELGQLSHKCINPPEALDLYQKVGYKKVIIERDLPGYDCLDLVKSLQSLDPNICIMLVADSTDTRHTASPFTRGISRIIYRPLNSKNTLPQLAEFVEATTHEPNQDAKKNLFETFRRERNTQVPFTSMTAERDVSLDGASYAASQKMLHGPQKLKATNSLTYQPQYLMAKSSASRVLLNNIWNHRNFKNTILIAGEQGCEFELVARELVYASGDSLGSPFYLSPEEITEENLASINAQILLSESPSKMAFVPSVETLDIQQATNLKKFIEDNMENPRKHLRIALGYCLDAGPDEVSSTSPLEDILGLCETRLHIQPLRERRSEIPALVTKIIADLATLHQFLRVRGIEQNALDYLKGFIWKGNFEQLVSVLRSAMANCPHRLLSMQQLEPLLSSDLTSFHLLESVADECLL